MPFNSDGFPDFSAHLYTGSGPNSVKISFTGSRRLDELEANKAAGFAKTPEGYTWHHKEDMTTMELVESKAHRMTGHSGGVAVYEAVNKIKYSD